MYLKSIELVGFKSFADRTKLEFEPGMMAIVGPNGCGKSNISDAVRWVLGEQSAKALRGGSMVDCVFGGTDTRKPLGMAEVSLTLCDCEEALGTEYNEVTVTRRVLRSGEGQYFINKSPCRLKDIQRLFMDTGVGTNAYSTMEQGRIDQILSSRPDDRRAVFEEASGITKYKADKKEALRKLDHTEANLLRLADIIKEVKRQIISLQRQAGKARRYQTMHQKLRELDLYATRQRLAVIDEHIRVLSSQLASLTEQDEALRHDVDETEASARNHRSELAGLEERISQVMEASIQAKTELGRVQELLHVNEDRIQELQTLSERDTRDAEEARARVEQHRQTLESVRLAHDAALAEKERVETELGASSEALRARDEQARHITDRLETLRAESVDLESRMAHLQNELSDLDSRERSGVIRRERLAAEQAEMKRSVAAYEERQSKMAADRETRRAAAEEKEAALHTLLAQKSRTGSTRGDHLNELTELKAERRALEAQVALLKESVRDGEAFPGGARWLLDTQGSKPIDQNLIYGSLADLIIAEKSFAAALEAVLRAWLDAVVVADHDAAHQILRALEQAGQGPARLVMAQSGAATPAEVSGPGALLLDHVECADSIRPLAQRLLGRVRVVDTLDQLGGAIDPDAVYVSRGGSVLRGDGTAEFWVCDAQDANPLGRQHMLRDLEAQRPGLNERIAVHEHALQKLHVDETTLDGQIEDARRALEESRRQLAVSDGENQVVAQEARQARERNETVSWELNALVEQEDTGQSRRQEILTELERRRNEQAETRATLATYTEELKAVEHQRAESLAEVTEQRVRMVERQQAVENEARRIESIEARITELEKLSGERRRGVDSYQQRIDTIQRMLEEAESRVAPLEAQAADCQQELQQARQRREEKTLGLAGFEEALRQKREVVETVRAQKTKLEVQLAEERLRRQNLIDRNTSEYRISDDIILNAPEPVWDEAGPMEMEQVETAVAELRAKLESMGPVNLVAIEEHQELEQRHAFLTQEQDDLLKAKQQLLEMIRKINRTTTEMFSDTFNKVNERFQATFKSLFGGGSAKLVLLDEEDVLESGIEIIARPPGKKLQTVSLLSGGERTMTAVALLFALYSVKPSPFCLLDELDAALDDANIGRFVSMLQTFLKDSQFIVITHNRQTIAAANVLYGITMESGVSNIISVKFSHHEGPTRPEVGAERTPSASTAP